MTTAAPYTEERLLTSDDWFNDMVAHLREEQAKMNDKTMPKATESMYKTFMVGNPNEIAHQGRKLFQAHFVPTILANYVANIQRNLPEQMAFAFNDNEILVWAELKDDDWDTEQALILAAAKTNAEFHKYGYDINTTFVEECDKLSIPNHYQPFVVKNL